MQKAKVYFTKKITPEAVVEMYKVLHVNLPGKVAVKVHSGEAGNQNYLHPEFMRPMVEYVKGTVVECNTAYDGERNSTEKHQKLIADHGWTKYFSLFSFMLIALPVSDFTNASLKLNIGYDIISSTNLNFVIMEGET